MKKGLLIIRWTVGLLFIFSGLIKANDPLGLSYKMQEFFEVWNWHGLDSYTLFFAMTMNVFEVLAGVAVIIGWRMRLFSWLLLLLIIFFTFLTGYALFSGKIKTCGCFGDCLPLSPLQSFEKDIALMILILVLFLAHKRIESIVNPGLAITVLVVVTAATTFGQFHVLKHLPVVDCLPYKKGNNILEQMQTPAGAIPDSFSIVFTYERNGKKIEFDQSHFPDDFDSTYTFLDRHDKLVKKGNGLAAKILDFSLQTLSGSDTTEAVFARTEPYLLVFAKDLNQVNDWSPGFEKISALAGKKKIPLILVTGDADKAVNRFPEQKIVTCDATVIKTAARVNPTYFIMRGATIVSKTSYADIDQVLTAIQHLP